MRPISARAQNTELTTQLYRTVFICILVFAVLVPGRLLASTDPVQSSVNVTVTAQIFGPNPDGGTVSDTASQGNAIAPLTASRNHTATDPNGFTATATDSLSAAWNSPSVGSL